MNKTHKELKDDDACHWSQFPSCRQCGKRFHVLGNDADIARLIEEKRDYCDKCLDEIDSKL